MIRYLVRSLLRLMLTVVTVTFLAFAAMNVFGNPLVNIMGAAALTPEVYGDQIAEVTAKYRLDEPVLVRYWYWLVDAVRLDFGRSYISSQSVSTIVWERLPVTILLVLMAQFIAIAVAVPWGLLAASREGGRRDSWSATTSFALIALPTFAAGVLMFYIFVVRWQWLPSRYDDTNLATRMTTLLIPAITLALPLMATYQRILHTELRSVLQMPFIDLARAKGNSSSRILWHHALRLSSFGLLTTFGINTGALIGGSLVIEQIFTVPGAGLEIVRAIDRDDYPLVLAFVVVISVAFVVASWLVDAGYRILDPRLRVKGIT